MATINRSYDAEAQIIGAGDNYITLAAANSHTATSSTIDLTAKAGVAIFAEFNFVAEHTDDGVISIYGSYDDANYDDIAVSQLSVTGVDSTARQASFVIESGYPYIQIKATQSGTTDDDPVRAYTRTFTWTSA